MAHCPAGTSVKAFIQLGQNFKAKKFQMYDYGPQENSIKYGQMNPPAYDLSKVTLPMAVFYGKSDLVILAKVKFSEVSPTVCSNSDTRTCLFARTSVGSLELYLLIKFFEYKF